MDTDDFLGFNTDASSGFDLSLRLFDNHCNYTEGLSFDTLDSAVQDGPENLQQGGYWGLYEHVDRFTGLALQDSLCMGLPDPPQDLALDSKTQIYGEAYEASSPQWSLNQMSTLIDSPIQHLSNPQSPRSFSDSPIHNTPAGSSDSTTQSSTPSEDNNLITPEFKSCRQCHYRGSARAMTYVRYLGWLEELQN